jgi:arsenite methyltransferase
VILGDKFSFFLRLFLNPSVIGVETNFQAGGHPMNDQVHQAVRNAYAGIASSGGGCGCGSRKAGTACSSTAAGYTDKEFSPAPSEADMGLGCGNPTAIASLRPGETVLDLGSGAGFDCFLASRQVGETGRVIGIDMTPEMISKARSIAQRTGIQNVEFRLGEIETLPLAGESVDVVISNCVLNLVPDKLRAFQEAFRVLKAGGRLTISDIALRRELPENIKKSVNAHVACIAGALPVDRYEPLLEIVGFKDVRVTVKATSSCISADTADPIGQAIIREYGDEIQLDDFIASIYIEGRRE